jgi:hypothetical protein
LGQSVFCAAKDQEPERADGACDHRQTNARSLGICFDDGVQHWQRLGKEHLDSDVGL